MTNLPKHILVIDDQSDVRASVRRVLEGIDAGRASRGGRFEITEAEDYRGAIVLLEDNRYDLVISDNNMPRGGEGLDLLRWARMFSEHHKETPFILHTSDDMPMTIEAVEKHGGIYAQKRVDPLGPIILKALALTNA